MVKQSFIFRIFEIIELNESGRTEAKLTIRKNLFPIFISQIVALL